MEGRDSRRIYRFSFNERTHRDIIDMIESIPRPFRGEFIAKAVRLMIENMGSVFGRSTSLGPGDFWEDNQKNKKGIDLTKTFD